MHGNRNTAARRARRGSVLIVALVALVGLMMVGAALARFSVAADREVEGQRDDRRAFYLAEAGLAEGMVALRGGASGGVASQAVPAFFAGGVLWVEATPLAGDQTQLVATAMAGSGRAALSVVVTDEAQDPLFRTVLNSREQLTMNSGVIVDSFDSEVGTYASQMGNVDPVYGVPYAKDGGHVASNEDIVMNSNAKVFGDAVPGPGYAVSYSTNNLVTGSDTPAPEPFSFPPIAPPPTVSAGPLSVPASGMMALGLGIYGFDDLTLNKAAQLTVVGPATLVVKNFVGGKDARLNIDATNGPVTIFVEGNYTHYSDFQSQPVGTSPMALAFMVQGTSDVMFPSFSKVHGAYYVPNANVVFSASCEAWGSFAANRIDMSSGMRFHYDESLAKHWDAEGSGKDPLRLLAWQPAAVPAALMNDRRDPFVILDTTPNALPAPADAWIP
ncbi:MAG TPA: pilus assembly PilX N-terminal domain-containing protein [Planctomycetota bacterium]|nr:pilus assembly PilX N-terminal domain-containing protein [Planctomycetota bacterium]